MQRKLTAIDKSYTNGYYPIPVASGRLDCGHSCRLEYRADVPDSRRYGNGHDESIYVQQVGETVECERCDWQAANLERLRTCDPATISHSRFRHNDSRGFGAGCHYVYERDTKSPTGCHLMLSLDDTPEAVEVLHRLSTSPLSPTEPR